MRETTKYIKNFNVGDKVTSTNSILLDRGFRGVTGIIRTLVKDEADSWQYLIDLDDGRELQCDDCHLVSPSLSDNQQTVLDWLKNQHFDSYVKSVLSNLYFYVNLTAIGDLESKEITAMVSAYEKLSQQEFAQVLQAYANWVLEQEDDK